MPRRSEKSKKKREDKVEKGYEIEVVDEGINYQDVPTSEAPGAIVLTQALLRFIEAEARGEHLTAEALLRTIAVLLPNASRVLEEMDAAHPPPEAAAAIKEALDSGLIAHDEAVAQLDLLRAQAAVDAGLKALSRNETFRRIMWRVRKVII